MSTYERANIILLSDGVSDGEITSLKPTDGSGDFTFNRASQAVRVNSSKLTELVNNDICRVDYLDGDCGALLFETESTNLVDYSEDISNGVWGKTNCVVTSNSTISPDGNMNADRVDFNVVNDSGRIIRSGIVGGRSYSIFLKYETLETVLVYADGYNGGAYINLISGAIVGFIGTPVEVTIDSYGNGWHRVKLIGSTSNGTSISVYAADNTPNFFPITVSGTVFAWGAQVEPQIYCSSYIPTTGAISTRLIETNSQMDNEQNFNISQGTFYLEIRAIAEYDGRRLISLTDGGFGLNYIEIGFDFQGGNQGLFLRIQANGSNFQDFYPLETVTNYVQIGLTYNNGEIEFYYNGDDEGTVAILNPFSGSNFKGIIFNNGTNDDNNYFEGYIKPYLIYFPTALTSTEMIKLTTDGYL